jgi:transglutaminase-like putative cysteine protease
VKKRGVRAEEYLPQATLLRLIGVLGILAGPHLPRLPLWEALAVPALLLWRATAVLRQWPMPPLWIRVPVTLLTFAGIWVSYGRINGQHPGVALLVAMVALKLTEMRQRRDVMVVMFMMYFMLVTHFLFSQELWTIFYLLLCTTLITAVLAEAHHLGSPLSPRVTLRLAGSMVLHSLPLMAVFFILFPRISGPLWGLPTDSGAARTGLSDRMSPGDIAKLIESDEIAFRVQFKGVVPPNRLRYWRGPVFDLFDGRIWRASFGGDDYFTTSARREPGRYEFVPARAQLLADPVRYEIMLEPHRQNWLFALDLPDRTQLSQTMQLTGFHQTVSTKVVGERIQYALTSYTRYRLQPEITADIRERNTAHNVNLNPRALALGRQWRAEAASDTEVIDRALSMFRREPFYYTLDPPALGRHSVDEFLFETRRGFCEHYASSFTVLLRAAGIPARVVTGYQGGERNELGDYYVVRQADAHAWSEVWLADRGWVRVDPTAAVAPSRIEEGISYAVSATEGLPNYLQLGSVWGRLRTVIDVRLDWIKTRWDRWVLAYGPSLQLEVLSRFGLNDWRDMIIALTVGVMLVLAMIGIVVLRGASPPPVTERAVLFWRSALKRLERTGLQQATGEGPRDFAERVAAARPDLANVMRVISGHYLALRYLRDPDASREAALADAVRSLRT